jgi:hypothetical protein
MRAVSNRPIQAIDPDDHQLVDQMCRQQAHSNLARVARRVTIAVALVATIVSLTLIVGQALNLMCV